MDKRLKEPTKQQESAVPETSFKQYDDESLIIKTDKIQSDKAYAESLIFNLVKRFDSLDTMEKKYEEALLQVESTPKWAKYYVHNQCTFSFQLT